MTLCRHCNKPESEHHAFEAQERPQGCVCDPGTWGGGPVGDICKLYVGNGSTYCKTCEHDEACHGSAK